MSHNFGPALLKAGGDCMKEKLTITVESEVVEQIESRLKDGLFRNKSHVVEYALRRFFAK